MCTSHLCYGSSGEAGVLLSAKRDKKGLFITYIPSWVSFSYCRKEDSHAWHVSCDEPHINLSHSDYNQKVEVKEYNTGNKKAKLPHHSNSTPPTHTKTLTHTDTQTQVTYLHARCLPGTASAGISDRNESCGYKLHFTEDPRMSGDTAMSLNQKLLPVKGGNGYFSGEGTLETLKKSRLSTIQRRMRRSSGDLDLGCFSKSALVTRFFFPYPLCLCKALNWGYIYIDIDITL